MKTKSKQSRQLRLKLISYGNSYYIKRITKLEKILATVPEVLQVELIGDGEIPADLALLIRSVLSGRSAKTRLVTNARSSLQGGSVLVWLSGDQRIIRDDARLYFRRVDLPEEENDDASKNSELKYRDSFSEIDPDDYDYARVLQVINEFLPVKELAGRPVGVSVLKEFGLIDNEKADDLLTTAFGRGNEQAEQLRTSKQKELMKEASK